MRHFYAFCWTLVLCGLAYLGYDWYQLQQTNNKIEKLQGIIEYNDCDDTQCDPSACEVESCDEASQVLEKNDASEPDCEPEPSTDTSTNQSQDGCGTDNRGGG